eukprot:SAG25_NODE_3896_length_935_cov_6.278708_1_plen_78_part_00
MIARTAAGGLIYTHTLYLLIILLSFRAGLTEVLLRRRRWLSGGLRRHRSSGWRPGMPRGHGYEQQPLLALSARTGSS